MKLVLKERILHNRIFNLTLGWELLGDAELEEVKGKHWEPMAFDWQQLQSRRRSGVVPSSPDLKAGKTIYQYTSPFWTWG